MRTLGQNEARPDFVGLIATARAAAALPVSQLSARDAANLVAAMFTAGYDRSAAQWSLLAAQADGDGAADLWALLSVGAPSAVVEIGSGRVSSFARDADPRKTQMLIAELAGLSRIDAQDGASLAQDNGFHLEAASS